MDVLGGIDAMYPGLTMWGMWDNDFEEERRYLEDLDVGLDDLPPPPD